MNFEVEKTYPINIFKNNGLTCSWDTVKVGWDLKRLTAAEISKFALDYFENNPDLTNEYISELVYGVKDYEIDDYLKKVFKSLDLELPKKDSPAWNKEWRKWCYAILSEMAKNIKNDEELLYKIEGVYADFNYPSDMDGFIYYMPIKDSSVNQNLSPSEARKKLIESFKKFLVEEKNKIDQEVG